MGIAVFVNNSLASKWCKGISIPIIATIQDFIHRFCQINAGPAEHIEGSLDLWGEAIPQLEQEVAVCCCKGHDECCLKSMYSLFCCIQAVVVGLGDLQLAIILGEKFLDVFGSLVVHDIQFWFESLLFQFN